MSVLALVEFLDIDPDDPVAEKLDFFGVSTSIFVSIFTICLLTNKLLLFVFARFFDTLFLRKILLYIQHHFHHTLRADDYRGDCEWFYDVFGDFFDLFHAIF